MTSYYDSMQRKVRDETKGFDGTTGFKTTMTDPDMGFWKYKNNAFGELVEQTSAKGCYIC
ncbi:MAG: hypothetical protein GY760_17860 [Deltaproteobacteria bacterium]|nr:hypothetical protein [Deltaproteobacteria bacterium]